ncbi:MAG: glycine--tRNA ligase [Candidatus Pacebacteria bacterium]|nr:glycine--tRNA ligase [Candidatus Paceibacterota bacterium]
MTNNLMEKIVSLSKRRGFVFPGSEIYGGLANSYEYGPVGVELKRNIQDEWWRTFVRERSDMVGLDSSIILHPKTWEASGHVAGLVDAMVECKKCHTRTRADHLIENHFEAKNESMSVEGKPETELDAIINENKIKCPVCGAFDWTAVRKFNLLFETHVGIVPEAQSKVYLRGETAQGIFVSFKNIIDSTRVRLPFGVGQLGKSFRNEITKGNFIFRTLEFEQAEIEYFFDPETSDWKELYDGWKEAMEKFVTENLGVEKDHLRWREHGDKERSFYSKKTEDLEYNFPFGFKELWGLAYRTDYDLNQHMKFSGVDLSYTDPATGKKFVPHVIEPAVGVNRLMAMVMLDAYTEDGDRVYLKLKPRLAPYKAAVFPLLANKPQLVEIARKIYDDLLKDFTVAWDDRGNIGKRYYAQDEIGTPFCITVDFDTIEGGEDGTHKGTVTVRDRDTGTQERVAIEKLQEFLHGKIYR